MLGKWVTLKLGKEIECRVYVISAPDTSEATLSESLQAISDHEYSRGYGSVYEAEQRLNKLVEHIKNGGEIENYSRTGD
ncbi:hypothetical protein EBB07_29145 [Paenibacillaceae bacterium]|nr:hypothetical protein EBB07_29145 [Paenibacillaceae bacterium]